MLWAVKVLHPVIRYMYSSNLMIWSCSCWADRSLAKCNESLDNKHNVSSRRRDITYGRTLLENLPFCIFSVVSFEGSLFPRFWIQNIFKTEVKSILFKSWHCVQEKFSQAAWSLEIRRGKNLYCENKLDPAVVLHKLRATPLIRMQRSASMCCWEATALYPLQRCSLSKSSLLLSLRLRCHPTRGIFHLLSSVPLLCICAQAAGSYSWDTEASSLAHSGSPAPPLFQNF